MKQKAFSCQFTARDSMGDWMFFLFVLGVVLANHTQYLNPYCYYTSMALPTPAQGTSPVGCWRGPAVMSGIMTTTITTPNVLGHVSNVHAANCCPLEAGGVLPLWDNPSEVTMQIAIGNTSTKCPVG